MKSIEMYGYQRPGLGKVSTKNLRREGKVPCVLYGGSEHVHFTLYEQDFKLLVYTPNAYKVKLDIEGNTKNAILKDIQFHPVNESIMHADFLEISEDKKVEMMVPVKFLGNAIGVRQGGKMIVKSKKLLVRCVPSKLPDFIEVNVEDIEIGKAIKVGDLNIHDIELLDNPNNPVVTVQVTRAVVEEVKTAVVAAPDAAAATPAAPEATPPAKKKGKD